LQTGAGQSAATLTSDTFAANAGPLSQVYLSRKAVLGSVYVSAYDGSTFDASGRLVATVPGGPPAPPGFQYNDAYNAVVFTAPLIPGSHVTISYAGLSVSANTNFQRYMINARINQKFKGFPGAEVGFTFNRIFDFDGLQTSADVTQAFAQPAIGSGAVSDTVFGLDFQTPLGIPAAATARTPVVYGEIAASNFTADYRHVAPVGDAAAVLGMRLRLHKAHIDLRYQDVGVNYLDGAPYGYFGNAPAVFSFYNGAYLPEFFGFGNTVAINRQFDRQFGANPANPLTAENPNLTFAYPLFNPLRGVGPTFYQAFTPNSRGLTAVATTPIQIGRTTVQTHLEYQHLEDIRPTSLANALGGAIYPTNVHLRDDTYGISTAFNVSAFGKRLAVDLGGAYETLRRPDASTQLYLPYNPATGGPDPAAVAAASAALPGGQSQVPFYPNYIDMRHVTLGAGASFPVSHDLGLSVRYSTQRFAGAYGTTLSQNISERKDFLSGTLTYRIPHSNSTIDFNARTYRYSDPNVPNYDFNQTQQNVNFTVRF
ncbi:MAG: hypothetical protein ACREM6_15660, partial [Vulcanimicrobiaceae bacterium]